MQILERERDCACVWGWGTGRGDACVGRLCEGQAKCERLHGTGRGGGIAPGEYG